MRHWMMGAALAALAAGNAMAREDYGAWDPLPAVFESTGGGGIMIGEYEPVVIQDRCLTRFTATTPDGTVYRKIVLFEALPCRAASCAPTAPGARWMGMRKAPRRSACSSATGWVVARPDAQARHGAGLGR